MKSKTRIIRTPEKALKELERIGKEFGKGPNEVKVGLPRGSNDYPDGTSVIMVGAVHEFGSDKMNIPERSYLRTTVVEKMIDYKTLFTKLSLRIIEGNMNLKKALGIIGLQVQTDVQSKIESIDSPPLKIREGNPLIDTGHLRQSITFEVDE
jgi:phage gpG-like protein